MKKLTKILCAAMAVMMTFALSACSGGDSIPVIGINQYGEHPSLDNCRGGLPAGSGGSRACGRGRLYCRLSECRL